MLVLSRRDGERVVIGDGTVITVTELSGGRAKLGIEAPPALSIGRGEQSGPEADSASSAVSSAGSAREAITSSGIRRKVMRRLAKLPR